MRQTVDFWFIYNAPKFSRMRGLKGFGGLVVGTLTDGWELSGNIPYASGRGYTPSFSISGNPEIAGPSDGARVNLVNPHAPANQGRWSAPLPYTFGNANCNSCLYGPSYHAINTSASKNFRAKDRVKLQLRLEGYNIFNNSIVSSIDAFVYNENPAP